MTIAAYQTLYESSVAFGMRKSLMSEQGKADMEEEINGLKKEKKDLEQQVERERERGCVAVFMMLEKCLICMSMLHAGDGAQDEV